MEDHRRYEAASLAGRVRASHSSPWQLCHADGCNAMPLNELGAPIPVDVRRWWCEQHRELAAQRDLEPRGSGVRLSPSGALVPIDEGEEAREAAAAETRRVELEARLAEAEVEADAVRRHDQARAEEVRRLLPPQVPG